MSDLLFIRIVGFNDMDRVKQIYDALQSAVNNKLPIILGDKEIIMVEENKNIQIITIEYRA